eukprot:TRINITY_DN24766_c0_g1_i5.p1 TRINITY_DN24766_c0_g1~~TRINITY_DN24766_c0_g1_i5.p1  ORF type:complete len:209 (-),score=9.53 TRINITY_DN24766_c0_g1_i5:105-731(-)
MLKSNQDVLRTAPSRSHSILLAGGVRTMEGVPASEAAWLTGLENANFELNGHMQKHWVGHSHVAVELRGTSSVLFIGHIGRDTALVENTFMGRVEVLGSVTPQSRRNASACCLSDGTVLLFGGATVDGRPLDDIWVGHTGRKTEFFLQVQREQSFLTKMHRRVSSARRELTDALGEERGSDPAVDTRRFSPRVLLDDLVSDLQEELGS